MLPQRVLFALGVLAAAVSAQTCPDGIRLLFKPTPSVRNKHHVHDGAVETMHIGALFPGVRNLSCPFIIHKHITQAPTHGKDMKVSCVAMRRPTCYVHQFVSPHIRTRTHTLIPHLQVQYTLVNKSKMKIDNMNVTIALPDTVTYKSSGMKNGVNKGTAGAVTTLATGVTWVNAGALAAGKSSIYWAEATVHPQADLLMFAGAAELTINGQTCTLVPPANAVRTKGTLRDNGGWGKEKFQGRAAE